MAGGAGHETGGVPHEENAEVCVVYSFSSAGRDGRDAHACRVMSTLFTSDTQFILSGSDDGNVRLWKANAADKLGIVNARERAAIKYRRKLVERWAMDDGIWRTMLEARRVKEERRRKHIRAGETKPKAEKKSVVIVEQT